MGYERTLKKAKQKNLKKQNSIVANAYIGLLSLDLLKNQLDNKTSMFSNMMGYEPMKTEDYEDIKSEIEKKSGLTSEEILTYVEHNSDLKDFVKKSNELRELFNTAINKN